MKKILLFTFFMSLFILGHKEAYSQHIPFQGRLIKTGVPVNDTLSITFAISDVSWTETHNSVIVQNGLYSVVLGSTTPLPSLLFDGVSKRTMNITVDGTALSPITLYPSLTRSDARFEKVLASDKVADTAKYSKVTGGGTTNYNVVHYTEANTNAGNIPYYGKSVSKAGSTLTQYGVVGEALGEGTGIHLGVYGEAASAAGKKNYGMYGLAYGPGDGSTGLENGSYNNGVIGMSRNNRWGNVGVWGNASGTAGVDNIGVVGWSSVNTGADTTVNNGVLGWAKGAGINRGVVGMATGGKQNWAGWFDGSVKIIGGLNLYNAAGLEKATLRANADDTGDLGGYFQLDGPSAGHFKAGFKHWEADTNNTDSKNLPYMALSGNLTTNGDRIWMNVEKDGNGNEIGSISLSSSDGKYLRLDPNTQFGIPTMGPNTENFLMTGKDWEGKPDYPIFELRGTINSQPDTSGYTLPLISLNTHDNSTVEWGTIDVSSGTIGGNTTENQITLGTAVHTDGLSGEAQFRGPNSDNVVIGSQGWEAGGADRGIVAVKGYGFDGSGNPYSPELAAIRANANDTMQYGFISVGNQQGSVWANLHAEGDGYMGVGNGTGYVSLHGYGDINASGVVTASNISQSSDRRYKTQIEPLINPLANVMKLRGVSYYWKDKSRSDRKQIGLIAQEVEAVYPEFVHTNKDGFKSVNYSSMVSVLIEAVKELQAKITTLEQEKQNLKTENTSLKAELEAGMNAINERMSQLEKLLGQEQSKTSGEQVSAELSKK
jgi:hypothetical protein